MNANQVRGQLRRKYIAEESYKALEGFYDGLSVKQLDMSNWSDEIRELFIGDVEQLAAEKNISSDDAASVLITALIRLHLVANGKAKL